MQHLSILRRLGFGVVVVLVLAITAAISSAQQGGDAPDAVNGHPIWDETVMSILGAPSEGAPAAADVGEHEGHLGWDKATG